MNFKSKVKKVGSLFSSVNKKIISSKVWKLFNVPNFLTLIRMFLIIPFVLSILDDNYLKACKILLLSGITDVFDGFLARLLKQETEFGAIFDPVVDKMTLLSIMICLSIKFPIIFPFVIILISKEFIMLLVGIFMIKKYKTIIKSKWYGKLGTAFFYLAITIIVGMKYLWNIENEFTINTLMWVTSLLMIFALIKYTIEFVKVVIAQKKQSKIKY